ncbi:MAG: hypothetical protein EA357_04590 [Micavibrio sp.]|nr:MAG: hypothetical protein EA357_04590 [Micavibrio sp.]
MSNAQRVSDRSITSAFGLAAAVVLGAAATSSFTSAPAPSSAADAAQNAGGADFDFGGDILGGIDFFGF